MSDKKQPKKSPAPPPKPPTGRLVKNSKSTPPGANQSTKKNDN
jgi:hypothetical protein